MAFMVSPGVNVSEIDLTTTVSQGFSTSVGAFAGVFQWGPANEKTLISSEVEMVDIFGKPTNDNYKDFFTAANFLSYSNALWVVRAASNTSLNSVTGTTPILVDNDSVYDSKVENSDITSAQGTFIARYPGAKGDSLAIAYCDSSVSVSNTILSTAVASSDAAQAQAGIWDNVFQSVPGTSTHAANLGGSLDEIHIAVIDNYGKFTGIPGTILEKFAFVSKAPGAKTESGNSNYYVDVINTTSKYVRVGGTYVLNSNTSGTISSTWATSSEASQKLSNGSNGTITTGNIRTAYEIFANVEDVDVSLILTGDHDSDALSAIIQIATDRKDAIAFVSPRWSDVQPGQSGSVIATNIVNYKAILGSGTSSYWVMDSGWKYQYDKYNDVYRWIPLNGDIAGLCARTDYSRDPWWSPAGFTRGSINNVIKLSWNPSQSQRDLIYKNGINPVVSFPGQGTVLYGDKTALSKPSAFDRINVRRLFIVLEKTISSASKYTLFEFNDAFTRSQFVSMIEPFLRQVQSRRGIFDFKVVCDDSNNPPSVVDANQFVGDIYIKPTKSINYIQLNFVAVRSGVEFSEVVGQF